MWIERLFGAWKVLCWGRGMCFRVLWRHSGSQEGRDHLQICVLFLCCTGMHKQAASLSVKRGILHVACRYPGQGQWTLYPQPPVAHSPHLSIPLGSGGTVTLSTTKNSHVALYRCSVLPPCSCCCPPTVHIVTGHFQLHIYSWIWSGEQSGRAANTFKNSR